MNQLRYLISLRADVVASDNNTWNLLATKKEEDGLLKVSGRQICEHGDDNLEHVPYSSEYKIMSALSLFEFDTIHVNVGRIFKVLNVFKVPEWLAEG